MQTATLKESATNRPTMSAERDLPIEIILGAAKYAEMARGTEHMVPSSKVMEVIAARRGWK